MGRPYSIDNYLKVKFTQSLNGVVSKMYNTDQKNDKHVPGSITLSTSPPLWSFSFQLQPQWVQTETSRSSCREVPGTDPAPMFLSLAASQRALPTPQAIWGEHPAGHPEEHHHRDAKPGPAKPRPAVAMALQGAEAP